jgi:hypothetical protein
MSHPGYVADAGKWVPRRESEGIWGPVDRTKRAGERSLPGQLNSRQPQASWQMTVDIDDLLKVSGCRIKWAKYQ